MGKRKKKSPLTEPHSFPLVLTYAWCTLLDNCDACERLCLFPGWNDHVRSAVVKGEVWQIAYVGMATLAEVLSVRLTTESGTTYFSFDYVLLSQSTRASL